MYPYSEFERYLRMEIDRGSSAEARTYYKCVTTIVVVTILCATLLLLATA